MKKIEIEIPTLRYKIQSFETFANNKTCKINRVQCFFQLPKHVYFEFTEFKDEELNRITLNKLKAEIKNEMIRQVLDTEVLMEVK